MDKKELKYLFNTYLNRDFTEFEWDTHGKKSFISFENEIVNCVERKNLKNKPIVLKNKKIGVILSGHIRNGDVISALNNLKDNYDIDVFIHTWDNIGLKGSETDIDGATNKKNVENAIASIVNVKDYMIETNKDFLLDIKEETEKNLYFNYSSPEIFIKSQLYSVQKSYELLENYSIKNNIKYDCVIKLRFDLSFNSFAVDYDLISEINNHKIIFVTNSEEHFHADYGASCWACDNMYHKQGLKSVHYFEHTNVICDLFAYGSQEAMKKYSNSYSDYDSLNKSFIEENLKIIEEKKLNIPKIGNSYQLFPKGHVGHLESLYYLNCSYPERIIQKRLKDYMLVETKKIKIKFNR
jgi:hypothetical protein